MITKLKPSFFIYPLPALRERVGQHLAGVRIKLLLIILATLSTPVFASSLVGNDLQNILKNFSEVLGPLITLILMISYVAGITMIFRGIGLFKAFGANMSQQTRGELAGPFVYVVVGAILLYIPETLRQLTYTMFGSNANTIVINGSIDLTNVGVLSNSKNLLSYVPNIGVEKQWADLVDTVVLYVQFIGFLAFIRGWFIISHAGQSGTQQGTITKGIVHIVGGLFAINFVPMVDIIANTINNG